MALITRVSRLFRADLHEVLDRVEEPDALLRQAVRDMEEELGADERRDSMLSHELDQIDDRKNDLERCIGRFDEELDLCFSSDKEDLARGLIKRKLEAQRYVEFLEGRRRTLLQNRTSLTGRIRENRSRLEAMRQKAEILAQESIPADPEEYWSGPRPEARFVVRDEDVEVALLRERQRRAKT